MMSHVTRIRTRFLDLVALEAAVAELGWTYNSASREGSAQGEQFAVRPTDDGGFDVVGGPVEALRRTYADIVVRRAAEAAGLMIAAELPQPDGGRKYVFVPAPATDESAPEEESS